MKAVNVIILSGSCCNPQLVSLDEKIQTRIKEVADSTKIQININIVTISSAAFGGLGLGKDVGDAVRTLMASKGMSVLPIVIFNSTIAFYGGLAAAELIEEKLNIASEL